MFDEEDKKETFIIVLKLQHNFAQNRFLASITNFLRLQFNLHSPMLCILLMYKQSLLPSNLSLQSVSNYFFHLPLFTVFGALLDKLFLSSAHPLACRFFAGTFFSSI